MLCRPDQFPSCHRCLWLGVPPYSLQATGSLIWQIEDLYIETSPGSLHLDLKYFSTDAQDPW